MWENRRHLSAHAHLEQPSIPTLRAAKVLRHNESKQLLRIEQILSATQTQLLLIGGCVKLNEHSSATQRHLP